MADVAVVTGAARGLGQGFAQRLAEDGFLILVVDVAEGAETVQLITDNGGTARAVECDVSEPADVARLGALVDEELDGCTVLVNNAGISEPKPLEDVTYDLWRRHMATNLDGQFLLAQTLAPQMKRKGYGRIINIASAMFGYLNTGFVPYLASKGGVIGLTRGLANDLGDSGVTVNAIAPGLIMTPLSRALYEGVEGPTHFDEVAARQAIKRSGEVDDITGLVAFLASEAAGFITGQTIVVDGGLMRAT